MKQFNYPEDARLTLAELSEWALTPADELLQLNVGASLSAARMGCFQY